MNRVAFGQRRLARIAVVTPVVISLLAGCASAPVVPQTRYQTELGRVAVVAGNHAPDISFKGFAHGKGEAALAGGGVTFLTCSAGLASGMGGCTGPFCGAVVILWLGVCGVAGTVGTVVSAVSAPKKKEVRSAETTMRSALDARTIQESLVHQVIAAAGEDDHVVSLAVEGEADGKWDYRPLADAGVQTVLEVTLVKVGTEGPGINTPVQLVMNAHARLVNTSDNRELFSADYDYGGKRLTISEWSANQGQALLLALQSGYADLGRHIYDNVFMLYPFPDRQAHMSGFLVATFGLEPRYPGIRGQLSGDRLLGAHFEWTVVDSIRPVISWEAFPRAGDRKVAPEDMARASNVRYDLIIARERNLAPDEVVYRREGLPEPRHQIETRLQPDARYFWTVRARFVLDGRERVTEWGATHFMARERMTAPSHWSYRFRTP